MFSDGFSIPRLDRIASVYLCHPAVRLLGPDRGSRVPILMYHSVSENQFGKTHPYFQINTSPEIFARQMKWLKRAGYRTIDLTEMLAALESKKDLSKTIVITFDDGYRDFYTHAFPVMKQCGFSATVFLATARIQSTPLRFEGAEYLTWPEVRELYREGVRFGSHTVTHADLHSLDLEQIDYELGYSKETIEQELSAAVESFAYSFAFPEEDNSFKRFLADILENHGFNNAVSTILGRAHLGKNRYYLPRLPVNSWDDPKLLRAKLEGGYDWLHWPQWMNKFMHHNMSLMQRSTWDGV